MTKIIATPYLLYFVWEFCDVLLNTGEAKSLCVKETTVLQKKARNLYNKSLANREIKCYQSLFLISILCKLCNVAVNCVYCTYFAPKRHPLKKNPTTTNRKIKFYHSNNSSLLPWSKYSGRASEERRTNEEAGGTMKKEEGQWKGRRDNEEGGGTTKREEGQWRGRRVNEEGGGTMKRKEGQWIKRRGNE